jgi:hypothetical protein
VPPTLTVIATWPEPVGCPSLTVTVTIAEPVRPAIALAVNVRVASLPVKMRLRPGTSAWLEESALRVSAVAALSISARVRFIVPERSSLPHVPPAATATVGLSLTGVTVKRHRGQARGEAAVADPVCEQVGAVEVGRRGIRRTSRWRSRKGCRGSAPTPPQRSTCRRRGRGRCRVRPARPRSGPCPRPCCRRRRPRQGPDFGRAGKAALVLPSSTRTWPGDWSATARSGSPSFPPGAVGRPDRPLTAGINASVFVPLYRLIQNLGKAAVVRRSLILRLHLSSSAAAPFLPGH